MDTTQFPLLARVKPDALAELELEDASLVAHMTKRRKELADYIVAQESQPITKIYNRTTRPPKFEDYVAQFVSDKQIVANAVQKCGKPDIIANFAKFDTTITEDVAQIENYERRLRNFIRDLTLT